MAEGVLGALSPPAYDHIIQVGRGAWQRAWWVRLSLPAYDHII